MKVTYPNIEVSGMDAAQTFLPVHSETGVIVSSELVRVTELQAQATVVEVRRTPARTVEAPTYLEHEG
jgi:hypothetical protein